MTKNHGCNFVRPVQFKRFSNNGAAHETSFRIAPLPCAACGIGLDGWPYCDRHDISAGRCRPLAYRMERCCLDVRRPRGMDNRRTSIAPAFELAEREEANEVLVPVIMSAGSMLGLR